MSLIKIYIASPYTIGDVGENIRRQLEAADELYSLGYAPFAPLLFHFQHIYFPRSYDKWLETCLSWIPSCNALLRLPGLSRGADAEIAFAKLNGVAVYYDLLTLMSMQPPRRVAPLAQGKVE